MWQVLLHVAKHDTSRYFRDKAYEQLPTAVSMNFEPYSHFIAFFKIFCFSNTRFDGHKIAAIFGKQGSRPRGLADLNMYWNHSPTIGHESWYRFQLAALFLWNGNEVPWGRTSPEPDDAVELDVHFYSISNTRRPASLSARACLDIQLGRHGAALMQLVWAYSELFLYAELVLSADQRAPSCGCGISEFSNSCR